MDYSEFFDHHLATGADVSVGVRPMPCSTAPELGILKANSDDEITRFVEKPQSDELIEELADIMDGEKKVLASMGIYIFNKEVLTEVLKIQGDDFGKNIIPHAINTLKTTAFRFKGYWEDIGTIRTFFESSIALTKENPNFTFYNEENPVYTRQRFLPGSEIRGAKIDHSIISEGCKVGNAQLKDSIIGIRSIIGDGVKLDRTYFMGADLYDNDESQSIIPMGVGENSILSNVIADKNVRIGKNVKLTNKDNLKEFSSDIITIKDGIIIIPKNVTVPDNFEI